MVIGATCPALTAAFAMVPYADAEGACGWRSARIAVVKAVSTADVWLESEAIADWMPVCVPDAAGMNANALPAAAADTTAPASHLARRPRGYIMDSPGSIRHGKRPVFAGGYVRAVKGAPRSSSGPPARAAAPCGRATRPGPCPCCARRS